MRPAPGEVLHFSEDPTITRFVPFGEDSHALVSAVPVIPLGPPEPAGDLLGLHEAAGIQLRVLVDLWPFWDAVVGSTLGFSGIRLRNALPRKAPRA